MSAEQDARCLVNAKLIEADAERYAAAMGIAKALADESRDDASKAKVQFAEQQQEDEDRIKYLLEKASVYDLLSQDKTKVMLKQGR